MVVAGIIWLFYAHGLDQLKNPEEWTDAGKIGEEVAYITLRDKFHIPENQIFRNVYIPHDGKTSEIDLLVVSKKGIFVFEVKNYGGNIYGDAKRGKWIQYLGKKKSYFLNPILQNKNHKKYLEKFLSENGISVPIFPMISTITRGNWKIKNLGEDDLVLGVNCHLKDFYHELSDSKEIAQHFKKILGLLAPLSRPDEKIREEHIEQIKNTPKA